MTSLLIAGVVFVCTSAGVILGMVLRSVLPESHLSAESKDVVKLGTGLIASMAALVLGLLVASAKSSFESKAAGFRQMALDVILLDQGLARFGAGSKEVRAKLKSSYASLLEIQRTTSSPRSFGLDAPEISSIGLEVYESVRSLSPADDAERSVQTKALETLADISRIRWTLSQPEDDVIPLPFLVVLVFWLSALFTSFSLFSPRNATVLVALFICSLSVACAIFLIIDMDQPFDGLIQVSRAPLRDALSKLGR